MRLVLLFTCSILLSETLSAQDAALKSWTAEVEVASEQLDVFLSVNAKQPLEMLSAYKWSNRARPVLGDRLCLLYINEGRPVASCKVYPTGNSIVYTPISFSDQPLIAKRKNRTVWTPAPSGVEFQEFLKAAAPSESRTQRGLQMKLLAREFTAKTGEGEARRQSSVRELRLLSKPLYRYEIADSAAVVFDGAVFVFVANGGNPQLFLIVEAMRDGLNTKWRYGFSRRTIGELNVLHKGKEVWHVEPVPNSKLQRDAPFHKITVPNTSQATTNL